MVHSPKFCQVHVPVTIMVVDDEVSQFSERRSGGAMINFDK